MGRVAHAGAGESKLHEFSRDKFYWVYGYDQLDMMLIILYRYAIPLPLLRFAHRIAKTLDNLGCFVGIERADAS